ncbi:MAG: formylglycine-generating enzyme family protein [Aureliella sp.]
MKLLPLSAFLLALLIRPAIANEPTPAVAEVPKVGQGFSTDKPADGPSVAVEGGFLVPYTLTVPGTEVKIEMVPIPGGKFKFGSSEDSDSHVEDEAPQVELEVGPMWVAKYETTWEQYQLYMSMYKIFKELQGQGLRRVDADNKVDAVTAPTELYDPSFTFKYGQEPKLPAVTMTQYAAKQYTKWLSKLTGQQYRLPTEAEWEYACRGGSEGEYHFGDDSDELDAYAWYFDNSDGLPHEVGQKEPNQYGLYDMHGNAMEWVIDSYTEDGYAAIQESGAKSATDAIQWPESWDNRCVRGGSFEDDPEMLRSAARLGSQGEDWKTEDPNVPLSPWWYTDDPTRGIGFRIFRSYNELDAELVQKFWDIDNEDIQMDVDMRLDEGRGVLTPVDPSLAEAIKGAQ